MRPELILVALLAVTLLLEGAAIMANRKAVSDIEKANDRMDEIIKVSNKNSVYIKERLSNSDRQIEEIVARMNSIVDDIQRLDHDEKEIRKYYLNYRDPVTDLSLFEAEAIEGEPLSDEKVDSEKQ